MLQAITTGTGMAFSSRAHPRIEVLFVDSEPRTWSVLVCIKVSPFRTFLSLLQSKPSEQLHDEAGSVSWIR